MITDPCHCGRWPSTRSESGRSSLRHRRGIGWSERQAGDALETASIPPNPKSGSRAKAPGERLHLDVTIIRLLDGTRTYLRAVIDNYSRRILSWTLQKRLGSGGTRHILRETVVQLKNCPEHTIVVADSGSENLNGAVDDLLKGSPQEACRSTRVGSRETNEGKSGRGMRRMRWGDEFEGVAIATAAVRNVVRRSSVEGHPAKGRFEPQVT
jgi:transposase InsO family protein